MSVERQYDKSAGRILAMDAFAVSDMGIGPWLEGPGWPVDDAEYFSVVAAIRAAYVGRLRELDGADRGVLMADYQFMAYLAMHAHALMVAARCAGLGLEPAHGRLSRQFAEPEWGKLGSVFARLATAGGSKLALRRLAKNALCNRQVPAWRVPAGLLRPDALGIGSLLGVKTAYARRNGLFVDNTYVPLLFAGCDFAGARPGARLNEAARALAAEVAEVLRSGHGVALDEGAVAGCLASRLGHLEAARDHLRRRLPRVGRVLVSEIARPLHRIAVHACRDAGIPATGFHHGNNMGGLQQENFAYNGVASVDEFVCPTPGSAQAFGDLFRSTPMAALADVRFTSVDTDRYSRLVAEAAAAPRPGKVRTVMVLGFPMNAYRSLSTPGNHFALHLELECRLMALLRAHGYKVLYKVHPERAEEARGLLDGFCDAIVPEPFEAVWDRADAFLIKDTTSTTFGHALCLNRPIVFLDFEKPCWRADHHELLCRRVRRVGAEIGPGCRVRFDEDELLAALAAPVGEPDMAYVESAMYAGAERGGGNHA